MEQSGEGRAGLRVTREERWYPRCARAHQRGHVGEGQLRAGRHRADTGIVEVDGVIAAALKRRAQLLQCRPGVSHAQPPLRAPTTLTTTVSSVLKSTSVAKFGGSDGTASAVMSIESLALSAGASSASVSGTS